MRSEEGGQVGSGKFRDIPPLRRLNNHRVRCSLLLTHTHGLLLRELLTFNLALLEDDSLEDIVGGEMDTTGRGEDIAVSLRPTQQFNPFLGVGYGEYVGALDRFERNFHHVTVVTLQ